MADGGDGTVAGEDDGLIGKMHQLCAERLHNLVHRAAPQICAADAAGKKSVSGKKLRRENFDFACFIGNGSYLAFLRNLHFFALVFWIGGSCRNTSDCDFASTLRKIQRDTAGSMSGGVNDLRLERAPTNRVTLLQSLIDFRNLGRRNSEEGDC